MRNASLLVIVTLLAAGAGCIVPEDMPALREELGYASVDQPDLVVKARASTQTPTVDEAVELTAETEGLPIDAAEITWDVNGTTHEGPAVETSFADAGAHPVTVEASGPNGTQATDAIEIQVQANQPPEAAVSIDAEQLQAGETVAIRAEASTDPDGDELTYEWRVDDEPVDAGPVLETELRAGPHSVAVTVTDGYAEDTAERTFAVDDRFRHQANLSLTDSSTQFPVSVADGLAEAEIALTHSTTQGADTVNLTLQDDDGAAIANVVTDPGPGSDEARAQLVLDGDQLAAEPHTLIVELDQGSETMATIEGVFTYSPLPSTPG